ncbi:hypothetical protein AB0N19_21375 [Streptomyces sp. NPDC051132]
MPAGKAIASVAMPTAVLMGMGFTSSFALADNNGGPAPSTPSSSAKSLTADEYKDCVKALDDSKDDSKDGSEDDAKDGSQDGSKDGDDGSADGSKDTEQGSGDTSASPSPSAPDGTDAPSPSATADGGTAGDSGGASSPDSGSGDEKAPEPTASSGTGTSGSGSSGSGSSGSGADTTVPAQPRPQGGGGVLDTLGDTLGDILTGGHQDSRAPATTPAPAPTPTASQSPSAPDTTPADTAHKDTAPKDTSGKGTSAEDTPAGGTGTGTAEKTGKDTAEDTSADTGKGTSGDTAKGTSEDTGKKDEGTAGDGTGPAESATPSPSASESASAEDCPVATDAEGGVDNKVLVADDPWYLNASSLLLKGADYQGIVEVRKADGTTKKVLKYVITGGTDIGDLHQTVQDKQAARTYHVQAAKGSTSTITGGDTVMYTESISGNLFGLIPVTFSPDSPPPLNIPLIYFTHVKVVQAAQFGGNLHVPGMHMYTTD